MKLCPKKTQNTLNAFSLIGPYWLHWLLEFWDAVTTCNHISETQFANSGHKYESKTPTHLNLEMLMTKRPYPRHLAVDGLMEHLTTPAMLTTMTITIMMMMVVVAMILLVLRVLGCI